MVMQAAGGDVAASEGQGAGSKERGGGQNQDLLSTLHDAEEEEDEAVPGLKNWGGASSKIYGHEQATVPARKKGKEPNIMQSSQMIKEENQAALAYLEGAS